MIRMLILTGVILTAAGLFLTGCNIFGWSGEISGVEKGKSLLRDGEYSDAAAAFQEAIDEDPLSSDALYGHAKAIMHGSGYNSLSIATILIDELEAGDDLPFNKWPVDSVNQLYEPILKVVEDLQPIYEGKTHGTFTANDIELDYAIALSVDGLLAFRDLNVDGSVDRDDYEFLLVFDEIADVFRFDNNKMLEYLSGTWQTAPSPLQGSPAQLDCDTLIVLFNAMLDNIADIISKSRDVITTILTEDYGLDIDEVNDLLQKVIDTAHKYKINDFIDNDGNNGADEETIDGIDNDGDGLYDEDSHYDCSSLAAGKSC